MKNLRSSNAAGQGAGLRKGNLCAKFSHYIVCLLFIFVAKNAFSQVTWADFGDYRLGYELSTSQSILSAGQQFHIKLYGDVNLAAQAKGFRFDLMLDTEISVDATGSVSLPISSFLGNSDELTTSFQHAGGVDKVEVYRSDDGMRTGEDWVVSLHCSVGPNGIQASRVVSSCGGVVIMSENPDLRISPGAGQGGMITQRGGANTDELLSPGQSQEWEALTPAKIKVFPNPTTHWVQLQGLGGEIKQVTLYDFNQRPVLRQEVNEDEMIYVEHLAPGVYHLLVEPSASEKPQVIKLLKR